MTNIDERAVAAPAVKDSAEEVRRGRGSGAAYWQTLAFAVATSIGIGLVGPRVVEEATGQRFELTGFAWVVIAIILLIASGEFAVRGAKARNASTKNHAYRGFWVAVLALSFVLAAGLLLFRAGMNPVEGEGESRVTMEEIRVSHEDVIYADRSGQYVPVEVEVVRKGATEAVAIDRIRYGSEWALQLRESCLEKTYDSFLISGLEARKEACQVQRVLVMGEGSDDLVYVK